MTNIKDQILHIKKFLNYYIAKLFKQFSISYSQFSTSEGVSVIEVILATALFIIFATGAISVVIQGLDANRLGSEETIANQYAAEGLEAIRSIKNQSFANLTNTNGTGITQNANNVWSLNGTKDIFTSGKDYTRVITIGDVQRNANGDIVPSGGTIDPLTKKITATVSWNFSATRNDTATLTTYLSNWIKPIVSQGGMLVYSDGGTTTNSMKYKILDGATNIWSGSQATANLGAGTSNRVVHLLKVFSSPVRNEKILLSKHYDESTQFFYGQVFNGTSWINSQLLTTISSINGLNDQNFNGTYLSDGRFLAVYSDGTPIARYSVWNGSAWSSSYPLPSLISNAPLHISLVNRPSSNEAMAAVYTSGGHVAETYFNGSSWTPMTEFTTSQPPTQMVDFAWSPQSPLIGALVYGDQFYDKNININVFTANGTGGGTWSTTDQGQPKQSKVVGASSVIGLRGADQFLGCDKDSGSPPSIICYISNFVPKWQSQLTTKVVDITDNGIQRSYHIGLEKASGTYSLLVYSDATNIPKMKKYSTQSGWDAAPVAIDTAPFNLGVIKTVNLVSQEGSDDIMILFGDDNNNLSTVVWNGTTHALYTSPTGRAFTLHSSNGFSTMTRWYDFAWNQY